MVQVNIFLKKASSVFLGKEVASSGQDYRLKKIPPLSQEQINRFIKKHGRNSERVLSNLGKEQVFYNAITSEIGQEILKDSLDVMERYLDQMLNETISSKHLAEYRVLRHIVALWSKRIDLYLHKINEIRQS